MRCIVRRPRKIQPFFSHLESDYADAFALYLPEHACSTSDEFRQWPIEQTQFCDPVQLIAEEADSQCGN